MNLALAGTVCGQLLTIFEFVFGYPESQESKDWGKQLEELECKFESDNNSPSDKDIVSKEQDVKDAAAQFTDTTEPKAKRRHFGKCRDSLKDLVPLNQATPLMLLTTVKLSETQVSCKFYTECEESEGQSIYRCKLLKPELPDYCTYYAAQLAAMCTHICRKHLSIYIQCCLCKKKSYSSTTMSVHLHTDHPNNQINWFKPFPTLEGDVAEVTEEFLAANLQEIKPVKEDPEEAE